MVFISWRLPDDPGGITCMGSGSKASQTGSDKNKFITGLKFVSININSIRGKKLELLAFLDFHQPQIVAIQETKIDSFISTSE